MRHITLFLLASAIVSAPMPVAAQVSVDLNALNGLGQTTLPAPPPAAPLAARRYRHRMHRLARGGREGHQPAANALASATQAPAGPETIEHPANLGPSFASLPALPGGPPPLPPKPPALTTATPTAANAPAAKPPALKPPALKPQPPEMAAATAKPAAPKPAAQKPAAQPPAAVALALPGGVPPPPGLTPPAPAATPQTRLAEATPPPPAAQPPPPKNLAPSALPQGADRLTLPFFVDESNLPPAETAMLRDFAQRYGGAAFYVIRAFASQPAGDDDPSTARRLALARAQSVAAALTESGVQPDRVRLLALGHAGGSPADRVEVIATPPSSGHTTSESTP